MKIEMQKLADGQIEMKMTGRPDEMGKIIENMDNAVGQDKPVQDAVAFMKKRFRTLLGR